MSEIKGWRFHIAVFTAAIFFAACSYAQSAHWLPGQELELPNRIQQVTEIEYCNRLAGDALMAWQWREAGYTDDALRAALASTLTDAERRTANWLIDMAWKYDNSIELTDVVRIACIKSRV